MIRLSPDPHSVIHRWPTEKSRRWVVEFLRAAKVDENVLAVVAVGSAVRPGVPSDDLDLVVICVDRGAFAARAPIEIDLRAYSFAEIDEHLKEGHDLLAWAVMFGRALYDPRETWRDLVRRWDAHLILPDPGVAEQRAEAALGRVRALEEVGDRGAANELRISYLTHRSRAALARAGVYPASRPELPGQLQSVGEHDLAQELTQALAARDCEGPSLD